MADEAVRQQKVTIQDVSDLFAWEQQHQTSSSVAFSFVSKETCSTAQSEIERFGELKPVPGTISAFTLLQPSLVRRSSQENGIMLLQDVLRFTNGRVNLESSCLWKQHMLKE